MNINLPMSVVIWTCVVLFMLTSLATILGLFGLVRLGGNGPEDHKFYLRWLFRLLLVEIIGISIAMYGAYAAVAKEQIVGFATLAQSATAPSSRPSSTRAERQVLTAAAYASSDANMSPPPARVVVPQGWRYVDATVTETTGNGQRAGVQPKGAPERDAAGNVVAVVAKAEVQPRALFGPNNWQGLLLSVEIERAPS